MEKLGADAIKEQQCINLKFSSDKVAVIPEDHAQRMLARVSHHNLTARLNAIYILFILSLHSKAFRQRPSLLSVNGTSTIFGSSEATGSTTLS